MSSRNHQARRTCGLAFAASLSLLICSVVPIAGYAQSFAISDVAFDEGGAPGNLTFTVTLDVALGGSATVDFSTADATATGGADYTPTSGTLTFLAGETTDTFTVGILADATDEVDEVFVVNLSNATGGASIAVSQAAATILDDDGPDITITDATANEGGTAQFFVLLSAVSPQAVTVDYSTADATATTITGDYTTMFGTLTFSPGETAKIVDVATGADTVEEGDEAFTVDLTNAANATITDGSAVGTITDDDAVSIAINDVTASESASTMTFTVSLSNPSAAAITVDYATLDGTATGGADYVAATGTLTINPSCDPLSVHG
jgi:hypothetical protein